MKKWVKIAVSVVITIIVFALIFLAFTAEIGGWKNHTPYEQQLFIAVVIMVFAMVFIFVLRPLFNKFFFKSEEEKTMEEHFGTDLPRYIKD